VSKQLSSATFRANDATGAYVGHVAVLPPNTAMDSIPTGATTFTIANELIGTTIRTHAFAADCTFTGTRPQSGQYGPYLFVDGRYSCTNGKSGNFYLQDLDVTYVGFTATLSADAFGVANIGGTRTGPF
jgi:hypothetical protein